MNAEELKLITEAITTLGAQGKEAFIWFLVLKYGVMYLLHAVLWPAAMFTVYKVVDKLADKTDTKRLEAIREIMFPNMNGPLVSWEYSRMIKRIAELEAMAKGMDV